MRFGLDSLVYLFATLAGTASLAGCSNSLHRRNINIGHQSEAAAARGITLIIATNDISAAGYALSVGAGGIAVTGLILFIYSLGIIPLYSFFRRIFFLSPLMLFLNTLLVFASGIAVTVIGRNNSATAWAALGSFVVPKATLQQQLAASGVSLAYWANGYVRFMVGAAWPVIFIGPIVTFFAYRAWRKERPSAQRVTTAEHDQVGPVTSRANEKGETTHVA